MKRTKEEFEAGLKRCEQINPIVDAIFKNGKFPMEAIGLFTCILRFIDDRISIKKIQKYTTENDPDFKPALEWLCKENYIVLETRDDSPDEEFIILTPKTKALILEAYK